MTKYLLKWDDIESQPICDWVFRTKYAHKTESGDLLEHHPEQMFSRVANTLAETPSDYCNFHSVMNDLRGLPGGRILANAGTGRNTTLLNCYVSPTIRDDMASIFDTLKVAALTQQMGGGIGMDFSELRPGKDEVHGIPAAVVSGVGAAASGPLSFMHVWDAMCRTIMSAGARRGAMMATMRCDHPNIEAFIEAKRDPHKLRMFNVSVLVTDAFMAAVKNDDKWNLVHSKQPVEYKESHRIGNYVYKTLRARDLWDKIMRATYDVAEPGVIFIDRINKLNNLSWCEKISATNPCGEQPLPPNANCNLAAVNVAAHITKPGEMDYELLQQTARTLLRMSDRVIDVSKYPTEDMRKESMLKRRTGIGIMGIGTALHMFGIAYGSTEGRLLAGKWMKTIAIAVYEESYKLAKEKGCFEQLETANDVEKFNNSPFIKKVFGSSSNIECLRNSVMLTVAPTGTTSMLARNVTSGIEPSFAWSVERTVMDADGSRIQFDVHDAAANAFKRLHPGRDLPTWYQMASNLVPYDHIAMQAAIQEWVDASISKTVNVPVDIPFDEFKAVYTMAYDLGCKGCTTYRPNDVTGAVLVSKDSKTPKQANESQTSIAQTQTLTRPFSVPGMTYKIRWPEDDAAYYVTCCGDGIESPIEVFISTKDKSRDEYISALTRLTSAVFRIYGSGKVTHFVTRELQEISDSSGGGWIKLGADKSIYCKSRVAMFGNIIERYVNSIRGLNSEVSEITNDVHELAFAKICPACNAKAWVKLDGCWSCVACGHSNCS